MLMRRLSTLPPRLAGPALVVPCSPLPATVAARRIGSPAALPTTTPDPDDVEEPDTGGGAPARAAPAALPFAGAAVALVGASTGAPPSSAAERTPIEGRRTCLT